MMKIGLIVTNLQYLNELSAAIRLQPDIHCVAAAISIEGFWAQLPKRGTLDIIFLEGYIGANQCGGAVTALRRQFQTANIILLTDQEDDQFLLQALHAGADGFVGKDFPAAQLPQMIRTVKEGGALITPRTARLLIRYFKQPVQETAVLNKKEEQLLRLFYEGHTYEECASILGLTVDGIKYHVKNIYRKLNVDNKMDAIRLYLENAKT